MILDIFFLHALNFDSILTFLRNCQESTDICHCLIVFGKKQMSEICCVQGELKSDNTMI